MHFHVVFPSIPSPYADGPKPLVNIAAAGFALREKALVLDESCHQL
jgi:hypothetical protein